MASVHCPRCLEEVDGDTCPNCGKAPLRAGASRAAAAETSGSIHVLSPPRNEPPGEAKPDWREEIRKKLDRHQLEKEGDSGDTEARLRAHQLKNRVRKEAERQKRTLREAVNSPQSGPEVSRQLFNYRLNDRQTESQRRIVTFRLKPEELAKPVIRKRTRPARKPEATDHRQRPLELVQRPLPAAYELEEPGSVPAVQTGLLPEEVGDEREVLFSRVLAGLLDLMVALLTGVLFGLVVATLMDSDLTSPAVMEIAGGCAAAFWFLNNTFFLFVARQTPGMMVTDLVLVPEPGVSLGLIRLVGRILLQILATASVVGLFWAIIDEQRRCWHDRLSRSLIVPAVSVGGEADESAGN